MAGYKAKGTTKKKRVVGKGSGGGIGTSGGGGGGGHKDPKKIRCDARVGHRRIWERRREGEEVPRGGRGTGAI